MMLSSHHNTKCSMRPAVYFKKKLDDDIDVNGGEDVDGDDIKTCFLQSKQWVDGSASLAIGGTFAGRVVKVCHDDDDDDQDGCDSDLTPRFDWRLARWTRWRRRTSTSS